MPSDAARTTRSAATSAETVTDPSRSRAAATWKGAQRRGAPATPAAVRRASTKSARRSESVRDRISSVSAPSSSATRAHCPVVERLTQPRRQGPAGSVRPSSERAPRACREARVRRPRVPQPSVADRSTPPKSWLVGDRRVDAPAGQRQKRQGATGARRAPGPTAPAARHRQGRPGRPPEPPAQSRRAPRSQRRRRPSLAAAALAEHSSTSRATRVVDPASSSGSRRRRWRSAVGATRRR